MKASVRESGLSILLLPVVSGRVWDQIESGSGLVFTACRVCETGACVKDRNCRVLFRFGLQRLLGVNDEAFGNL